MTGSSKPVKEKLTIAQWFERNGFPGMTPKSFKHHYSVRVNPMSLPNYLSRIHRISLMFFFIYSSNLFAAMAYACMHRCWRCMVRDFQYKDCPF